MSWILLAYWRERQRGTHEKMILGKVVIMEVWISEHDSIRLESLGKSAIKA